MTPQSIIYNAWKNTEKPIIYETVDAKGNTKRKELDFAVPEKNAFYDTNYDGECNVCGEYTHGGIPIKKMFSSSYMDWAIHKSCESTHICSACSFCVGMNPNGRIALFRYPIVAEKTLHLCNKRQFRDFLMNPPEPPFVMILPTSQKKHLFAKSKVSYSKENFLCNVEEITIPVNKSIADVIMAIEALRGIGIKRSDIESGKLPCGILKIASVSESEKILKTIENVRNDQMFILAIEVAQKMNEEEARCYLDLTPKMK